MANDLIVPHAEHAIPRESPRTKSPRRHPRPSLGFDIITSSGDCSAVALRVLLISFNRYKIPDPVYPLGLTYLAEALLHVGHEVEFVDLIEDDPTWYDRARAFAPHLVGISVRNVDEVCITSKKTLLGDLPALVEQCRQLTPGPVLLGGPAVSLFPVEILDMSGADYVLRGEGEDGFTNFCDRFEKGEPVDSPWLLKKGEPARKVQVAPGGFCLKFNEELRRKIAPYYLGTSRMLNIQTQRGCPMKCSYCTYPALEGRFARRKSVEAVIEELQLMERLGARYFFIADGVFNTSSKWVAELCEGFIRAKIKMKWCAFLKPAHIERELAFLMARAGMTHAECGTDSLSDEMLKGFGKRFGFAEIQRASGFLREAGIKACHFMLFGGVGETRETVAETFANSARLPGAIFFASSGLRVYPDTPLFDHLVKDTPELRNISMLEPYFYLSPNFTEESIEDLVREHAQKRSEWILFSNSTYYQKQMDIMRRKGKTGPLWDYMELIQRLQLS